MCYKIQRVIRVNLWHKQLNYDITTILQIWVNTYVNPEALGINQSRIPCLSCCWKKLVVLHILRQRKHELVFKIPRGTKHRYLHGYFNNKGLYKDYNSGCNYVIQACPIIVCYTWRIFFEGVGRQIGVHDGYIHRFIGLKFLWITQLEPAFCRMQLFTRWQILHYLSCAHWLQKSFQRHVACTGSEWGNCSCAAHSIVVRWKWGSSTSHCGPLKAKLKTTSNSQIFLPYFYI